MPNYCNKFILKGYSDNLYFIVILANDNFYRQ